MARRGVLILVWLVWVAGCSSSVPFRAESAPGEPDPTVNRDLHDGEPLSPGDRIDLGQADLTLLPQSSSRIGSVIAFPGDLDGDGYGEVAIGSTSLDGSGFRSVVHIVYGSSRMSEEPPHVATLEGWWGATGGISLAAAGDIDGDGRADLLVGVISGGPNTVVLVYGGERWSGARELRTAGPVLRDDEHDSAFGVELSGVGDVDGDGFADFAIGAPSSSQAGALYVFHGRRERLRGRLAAVEEASYVLRTAARDVGFGAVRPAGDVNGDSLADFIAMMDGAEAVHLVLGSRERRVGAVAIESASIRLRTSQGAVAVSVGDLDGDGMDEIGVTAGLTDSNAYVLYGRREWPSDLDAADTASLRLPSMGEDGSGCIVLARGGDFNGDGHADLLCFDHSYHHGALVVVLGVEGGLRGDFDMSRHGLVLLGRDGSGFTHGATRWAPSHGPGLASGFDLDGDGRDDLAIGFPDTEPDGTSTSGLVHVLLGRSTR